MSSATRLREVGFVSRWWWRAAGVPATLASGGVSVGSGDAPRTTSASTAGGSWGLTGSVTGPLVVVAQLTVELVRSRRMVVVVLGRAGVVTVGDGAVATGSGAAGAAGGVEVAVGDEAGP
jgi:hypothetical protein